MSSDAEIDDPRPAPYQLTPEIVERANALLAEIDEAEREYERRFAAEEEASRACEQAFNAHENKRDELARLLRTPRRRTRQWAPYHENMTGIGGTPK